jgi:hypothetical protein
MPAVDVPISTSHAGNFAFTVSAIAASTFFRTSGAVRINRLSQ